MAKSTHHRAIPTQKRSRERYDAILRAAARVFAEIGFDRATTQNVADRAETSIGSLYHFFGNKEDLLRHVIERLAQEEHQVLQEILKQIDPLDSWEAMLDVVIDASVVFHQREPGWLVLWMNLHLYQEYAKPNTTLVESQVESIEYFLTRFAPELTSIQRRIVATVTRDAITGMLLSASRRPQMHDQIVAHTKLMVKAYLGSFRREPFQNL